MRVLVVLVAFLTLRNLYNSLLFANGRFRITSIAIITSYVTYLAGMLATIHYDWGLRGVAATFVAQQVVGTLISVPAGVRYVDRRGVGWISRPVAKEFFDYAWRVQITGLIYVQMCIRDRHYYIALFGGPDIRVADYATYGSAQLAANVERALNDPPRRAALMANHGSVVAGPDLRTTYTLTLELEWLCELYLRARTAGTPRILSLIHI